MKIKKAVPREILTKFYIKGNVNFQISLCQDATIVTFEGKLKCDKNTIANLYENSLKHHSNMSQHTLLEFSEMMLFVN